MKARPGEWLVIESAHAGEIGRTGEIIAVDDPEGLPPYRVRWLDSGHESLIFPGPDSRVMAEPPHSRSSAIH